LRVAMNDNASPVLIRYFSVAQVAKAWNMSRDKVRELFEDEPDVLKIGHAETRRKRRYVTLRIPESAILRVQARLQKRVN
jgi:hypothetical protein